VREIDGASNNGVDEIRELRENIKFSPVSSRYKIYIIDEVHMLSKPAFNALLKTLEEPPPHVVFIFATTEIPKVPATILSRCQRFDFKRISVRQIAENLGHIAREEKIAVSDVALSWIAREGQGSLRDAQSIFDQVISYAGKEIKDTDVEELLDLGDRLLISELAGAVIARDAGACLKIIDDAYYSGADVDHFYRLLLEYFMNLLTAKVTDGKGLLADLPDHEVAALRKLAEGASQETIQPLLDILMAEEYDIRKSPEPRINLEYAVVKMAYLEPLVPIDEILARMEGLEQRLGGGVRGTDSPAQRPAEGRPVSESSSSMRYRQGDAGDPWQALKGFIKEKNPPLSSKIDNGTFISYENGRLRVGFPKGYLFLDVIRSETQQNLLQRMAEEFFGEGTTLEIATLEDEPRTSGAAASNGARRTNDIKNEALRDPLVQKVMDVFPGAEIVDVRVNGSRRQ
jgi:DNA polymerase-3 subunit gamma/tau